MGNYNQTSTDFILLGLFPSSRNGLFLFILIVLIFLMALVGNLSMILLILLDIRLHKPMYFLLSQLSLMDLNYISTTVPKMAYDFLFANKSISITGCGTQSFFFLTMACAEGLLLASMAYDRYVAICFPLHYPIKISKRVCILMITGSWIMGSINSCAHTTYILSIPYCQSRSINHFFCDVTIMLTIACIDTTVYEYTVFLSTTLSFCCPSLVLHFPMAVFSLLSIAWTKQKGRRRPIQPAAPTSLWFLSTMHPLFTRIYAQDFYVLQQRTKFWLSFTSSLPRCSILLSIVWETRRWLGP